MQRYLFAVIAALTMIGCSDDAPKKAETKKVEKPEALTGRQAFQQMYISARGWAPDAQPLLLKSMQLSELKAEPGKAAAWQCTFVSPSRGKAKSYTWSAVEAGGNLHQGVFAGPEESYTEGRQSKPYLIAAIKHDSDEAYAEALKKSADYVKKNPDKPVNFLLEQTPRFPDLAWRVIWGESAGTAEWAIFVDATTGAYLQGAH